MTDQPAYYRDSYSTILETTISGISGNTLVFADTIFYPEGGGQPGDHGQLETTNKTVSIIDTKRSKDTGEINHEVDDIAGFQIGQAVRLNLDWDRRYAHMRMHTALHLLGSLVPVPVTGGSIGAEKSRLDFDLGEHQIDKTELTEQMNDLIKAGHNLEFSTITDAELDANPELVRTMSVQPPRGSGAIRMVRITDVDYQPCGGTHLNCVSEIGPVEISKIENKGKKNRRVHLKFKTD
ncbi:MAG: misacylated tRNA(Ala) deacylase [Candidatus Azotimanducaceae bacterium]|jgi:misacylated tRNA(Ala) deacylase